MIYLNLWFILTPLSEGESLKVNLRNDETGKLEILTLSGKSIKSIPLIKGMNEINTLDLENGIYIIKLNLTDKEVIRKIVIK